MISLSLSLSLQLYALHTCVSIRLVPSPVYIHTLFELRGNFAFLTPQNSLAIQKVTCPQPQALSLEGFVAAGDHAGEGREHMVIRTQ